MTNFRNKQWFKQLSDEKRKEICENFMIDEKTLRHAGRAGENGEIRIDLLRIDHINYIPKCWINSYDSFKDKTIEMYDEDKLESLKNIYLIFNSSAKFLKYNDNVRNKVLVNQCYKSVKHWIEKFNESKDDIEYKQFCSNQIRTIIKILFENDLCIAKQKYDDE